MYICSYGPLNIVKCRIGCKVVCLLKLVQKSLEALWNTRTVSRIGTVGTLFKVSNEYFTSVFTKFNHVCFSFACVSIIDMRLLHVLRSYSTLHFVY